MSANPQIEVRLAGNVDHREEIFFLLGSGDSQSTRPPPLFQYKKLRKTASQSGFDQRLDLVTGRNNDNMPNCVDGLLSIPQFFFSYCEITFSSIVLCSAEG
eukprot:TRINITY_DN5080_c0_g1_i1.p2 TRINITY_DN5080_c0_g1~~TRINITY_DN5080_c0_g1_i1.p2  ORF type:complete len:101 (-),score=11.53 TRINITY_DN5080_c0_g1_i1:279-581(-)